MHAYDKWCEFLWFANRPHLSGDLSEEEEGLSSNEEDDNSSTSSKDEMDHSRDKEVRPPMVQSEAGIIITIYSDYSE